MKFKPLCISCNSSKNNRMTLEDVYQLSEDNPWQPVTGTAGILIKAEEICYIEFWKDIKEDL
jgi:hypothetical protein